MQSSAMFHLSAMHQADLMREVTKLRMAQEAAHDRPSRNGWLSQLGSLASRIAQRPRPSTRRRDGTQGEVWQSRAPQQGTLTTAD